MPAAPVVIVGGGLTAATAAEGLRSNGYDGLLTLIGAEPHPPYHRPALSKGYLQGRTPRTELAVFGAERWAELGVDLRLGVRADELQLRQRRLRLDDGDELAYQQLLLATGATARRLPIPGADLAGVHQLRTMDDSDRLREQLSGAGSLVVIGAGWIGTEVAATARALGLDVTVIDPAAAPLVAAVGAALGNRLADLHRDNGVRFAMGVGAAAIEGDGRAERVRTEDGRTFPADAVVVGVGAVPAVDLGQRAGLATATGVLVDTRLRTSAPDVFAAGDVAEAEHNHYRRPQRFEHWHNAKQHGMLAAASMLGRPGGNGELPYFFSTQYGRTFEMVGLVPASGRLSERGDFAEPGYQAVWSDTEGRPTAALAIDAWGALDRWRPLITAGRPLDPSAVELMVAASG